MAARWNRYARFGTETTYGTAAASTAVYLRLMGESLATRFTRRTATPERLTGPVEQWAARSQVGGTIDLQPSFNQIGFFLKHLLGPGTSSAPAAGEQWDWNPLDVGAAPGSMTAWLYRDVEAHQYVGLFPTAVRLNMRANQNIAMQVTLEGKEETLQGLDYTTFPSYADTLFEAPIEPGGTGYNPTVFTITGITGGDVAMLADEMTLELRVKERAPIFASRITTPVDFSPGNRFEANCSFSWKWNATTQPIYADMLANTAVGLNISVEGLTLGSGVFEKLQVQFDESRLQVPTPRFSGAGFLNIRQKFRVNALWDSANETPVRVTLINASGGGG